MSKLRTVNMRVVANAMGKANVNTQTKLAFFQAYRPGNKSVTNLIPNVKAELKITLTRLVKLVTLLELSIVDEKVVDLLKSRIKTISRSNFKLLTHLIKQETGVTDFNTNFPILANLLMKFLKEAVPRRQDLDTLETHTRALTWFQIAILTLMYSPSTKTATLFQNAQFISMSDYFETHRGLNEVEFANLLDIHTGYVTDEMFISGSLKFQKKFFEDLDNLPLFTEYAIVNPHSPANVNQEPRPIMRRNMNNSPPAQLPEGLLQSLFPHPSFRYQGIRKATTAKRSVRRKLFS